MAEGAHRWCAGILLSAALAGSLAACDPPFKGTECRPPFSLPPSGRPYLEFLAVGDVGTGDDGQAAVARAMGQFASASSPSFVLMLGDNFYPDGVASTSDPQWQAKFEQMYPSARLAIPFYAVLGNHDYRQNEEAQVQYTSAFPDSRWEMPARYYSFARTLSDSTVVDFFAIDTVTIQDDESQLAWLESQLASSSADWQIVFGHHVLYSNGAHGTDQGLTSLLLPRFAEGGVDLYLSGHDHDLQILKPVSGVNFFVSGTGSSHRPTRCLDNTIYAASRLGFMAFRVSRTQIVPIVVLADGETDFAMAIAR